MESHDEIKNRIDQIIIQYKDKSKNFVLIGKSILDKNGNFSKLKINNGRESVDPKIKTLVVSR